MICLVYWTEGFKPPISTQGASLTCEIGDFTTSGHLIWLYRCSMSVLYTRTDPCCVFRLSTPKVSVPVTNKIEGDHQGQYPSEGLKKMCMLSLCNWPRFLTERN